MIDIVFPYINGEDKFCELKYAIRSIEKNFKDKFRIVLVGDWPEWANKLEILQIPHRRHAGPFSKVEDSINKMQLIIDHKEISDPFIYWYDDIYLLKPVEIKFFKQNTFALKRFADMKRNMSSNFFITLWNTFDALQAKFPQNDICNFETHLPRLFYKDMMQYIISEYDPYKNRLLVNTLYFQEFSDVNENYTLLSKKDNIKAGFYGTDTDLSFGQNLSKKEITNLLAAKTFLNHDDNGLSADLKEIIIEMFKNKSLCEH